MEAEEHLSFIRTLLPFVGVIFLIAIGVILLTQQFRKNLYKEELKQVELRRKHITEISKSTIMGQELERKRISQDLHDSLGAVLSIVRMHILQIERKHGSTNPSLASDLMNIRSLTENAIESMRRISHELMPPQIERFGVLDTLEQTCRQVTEAGNIKCKFTTTDQSYIHLTEELMSLTIYRVCLELINNTIKHSNASELSLEIIGSKESITIEYKDNGDGIDLKSKSNGAGLKNMNNRINSLSGTIEYNNEVKGISVFISFPNI